MCQNGCKFEDSFTGDCKLKFCYFDEEDIEEKILNEEEERTQYEYGEYMLKKYSEKEK